MFCYGVKQDLNFISSFSDLILCHLKTVRVPALTLSHTRSADCGSEADTVRNAVEAVVSAPRGPAPVYVSNKTMPRPRSPSHLFSCSVKKPASSLHTGVSRRQRRERDRANKTATMGVASKLEAICIRRCKGRS